MNTTNTQASQPEQSGQPANENNNEASFKREQVENTPFDLIYNEKDGWFIMMGNHCITERYPTKLEALTQISTNNWKFMTTVIACITENVTKILTEQA
jgi:hypothetical protein